MFFSIYNPTITNFYIRLEPDFSGNVALAEDKNKNTNKQRSDISFDFMEGMLNSFCKKEVNVTFKPRTRASIDFEVHIYTTSNSNKREERVFSLQRQQTFSNLRDDFFTEYHLTSGILYYNGIENVLNIDLQNLLV